MALDAAVNFAKSALASGITSGAGSLTLVTGGGAKFAVVPWNGVIYNSTDYSDPSDDPAVEIVRCTVISTDTLTITRGQESTSAANHNTAGKTYTLVAGPTAKLLTDILGISITGKSAATDALNSATTAVNVAAATAPSANQVLTATGSTAATWQGPQVSSVKTCYVQLEPNFTTVTSDQRLDTTINMSYENSLVQLAPQTTWTKTIADAKTNAPGGWTWTNASALAAGDENTTTSNALHLSMTTGSTDWGNSGTHTCPFLNKSYVLAQPSIQSWVARVSSQTISAVSGWTGLLLVDSTNLNKFIRFMLLDAAGTMSLYLDNSSSNVNTAAVTSGQANAGVWLRVDKIGANYIGYYSLVNQATPPTSWTLYGNAAYPWTTTTANTVTLLGGILTTRTSGTGNSDVI